MSEAATNLPTQTASAPDAMETLTDRANAIFGEDAPPAAENDVAAAAEPAAAAPVVEDEAAKQRAARREALRAAQAKERERVDAITAIRENEALKKRLAETEERAKAYANHIDPSKLTKAEFFALAEKNPELTPQELGEWLRERMANPEAAAARSAKAAVDPEIAKLREELAAEREENRKFRESLQTDRADADDRAAAQQLMTFANENAATSPLTARFISAMGAEAFTRAALSVAQNLPPGAGPQAILDEIEESLIRGQRDYQALYGPQTPQRTAASTLHQSPAAAKAPTHVSNTLAQQRSSVVDEQADFARLSLEERAAKLFGG